MTVWFQGVVKAENHWSRQRFFLQVMGGGEGMRA